ncbi:MAG: DUF1295 domain-containing protein [Longimicrobiales bacterium]|nr:DUF1295 domain-containing protein [Longimicrobiales bacterium]
MIDPWLAALPLLLLLATALWGFASRRADVSVVDVAWGPAFAVVALTLVAAGGGVRGTRAMLALGAVLLWAVRLALHLGRRWARASGEDRRYAAMRARDPEGFPRRSLATVFWLQAVLAWLLSVPLAVAVWREGVPGLLGWAGALTFLTGFAWEAVADAQLARFRSDPAQRGRVLTSGLWRLSRHPNYFGEIVLWWGFYLLAADAGGWWTFPAPAAMTLLLLRVSGVPLLEPHLNETRPGYREYAERTPAVFPRLPGR